MKFSSADIDPGAGFNEYHSDQFVGGKRRFGSDPHRLLGLHNARKFVLVNWDRGMVVQTLGSQHFCQVAFCTCGLFQFRPLVLEPDLDLGFVQPQLVGERPPSILIQVSVLLKLFSQPRELLGREGSSWSFFVRRCRIIGSGSLLLLFDLPHSRSCKDRKN